MGDYTPIAMPGMAYTLTASGTIAGGDLVGLTGALTVAKVASAASLAYVGVAGHDAVIGQKLTVHIGKAIHESVAEGAITAGDQIVSSSAALRQVKSLAPTNVDVGSAFNQAAINTAINGTSLNNRGILGIAVTTVADNQTVRWVQR